MSRDDKKSSGVAKTALGLAIGGLSLAAVNGGLGGSGGLLGNILGQNEYQMAQEDLGKAAVTELNMLEKWIMPVMSNVSNLQTQLAVNTAVDEKNQVITGLLFQMAENNTNSKFALFDAVTNGTFRTISDRMTADNTINRISTDAAIGAATCNVMRGTPYISPQQMADPYQAGTNVLVSRHVQPVVQVEPVAPIAPAPCGYGW